MSSPKRKWSQKYKDSIDCNHPKGFSQKQHCKYGRKSSPKRKSPKRKSPKRKSSKRKSPKRKSPKRKSPNRKSRVKKV